MRRILQLSILAFMFPISSLAASFDCSRASTPVERLTCANPQVSAADDQMAQAYGAVLERLPHEWQMRLKANQKAWLHYVRAACALDSDLARCLADRYKQRATLLNSQPQKMGDLLVLRLEEDDTQPSPDSTDLSPLDTTIAYPQIISPKSDSFDRWNREMMKKAQSANKRTDDYDFRADMEEDYKGIEVRPDTISVVLTGSEYVHGAAHPIGGYSTHEVVWVRAEGRWLQDSDIFDPSKDWRGAVAALVLRELIKTNSVAVGTTPEQLQRTSGAIDLSHFSLAHEGLIVKFDAYELGSYMNAPTITIPWSELASYLAHGSPITIPPA